MNKKSIFIVGMIVLLPVLIVICLFAFREKPKITYTITFDSGGGSLISQQVVEEGDMVIRPSNPIRNGYVFIDWLLDGQSYNFNSVVDRDITLKANWRAVLTVKNYVVTFNTDGGNNISKQIIVDGKKVLEPSVPEKKDYTFLHWSLDGEKFDFNTIIDKDIELVAVWEKKQTSNTTNNTKPAPVAKKYTVTFNSDGGTTIKSQTITEGNKVVKPSDPSKEGYTFKGWQLNGQSYNFNSAVNGNITLKAVWEQNVKKYTVSFNSNGGNVVSSQTVNEGNKAVIPSVPTREGYTFKEWQLNGQTYNFDSAVNSDIALTAIWTQKNYEIRITPVDAYSPDVLLQVLEDGQTINVSRIEYTDGVLLCSGSNLVAGKEDLTGESKLVIVLQNGTKIQVAI